MKLSIPEQIIILQRRNDISHEQMAAALDISVQSYTRRLRLNSFTSSELEKIAELFKCSIQFN